MIPAEIVDRASEFACWADIQGAGAILAHEVQTASAVPWADLTEALRYFGKLGYSVSEDSVAAVLWAALTSLHALPPISN
jgi:hypothetical protein